jgi:hypothetical protein
MGCGFHADGRGSTVINPRCRCLIAVFGPFVILAVRDKYLHFHFSYLCLIAIQCIFFTRKAVKNTKQKGVKRENPHRPKPEE